MLSYDNNKTFGVQEFKLNLLDLYPSVDELKGLKKRYSEFVECDRYTQKIFSLKEDILTYSSEVFISDKIDKRPPLLLLLGNPASHSIIAGMCFAFEKDHQEHRFWRLLEKTEILKFSHQSPLSADPNEINEMRRNALWELNYQSPFRIGIAVFYSLPSPASNKWSGVSGLIKLLGIKAFRILTIQEEIRIATLVSRFIGSSGGIITFQKDAYEGIRSPESRTYEINEARLNELKGKYKGGQHIFLAGAPPTREANWAYSKNAMVQYKNWLTQQISLDDFG
jgi:hypothetical protein